MSFTNHGHWFNDQWADIVYIHDGFNSKMKGYYSYVVSCMGNYCSMVPYAYPMEGLLYITKTVKLDMVVDNQHDVVKPMSKVTQKWHMTTIERILELTGIMVAHMKTTCQISLIH